MHFGIFPNIFIKNRTQVQALYKKWLAGLLQGMKVHLNVDEKAPPKFHKARTVPFAYREKVEAELQKLESQGHIPSNWAAPIVPVARKDNTVGICGNYKITVNHVDSYPLPRVEELFSKLAGGKYFSKLDLNSQAYLQLPLDEKSKEYVKGALQVQPASFWGVVGTHNISTDYGNASEGNQRIAVYIDDILVTGATIEDHLRNLEAVLSW